MTAPDLTDMAADFLTAREPMRCPCGAECSHSHGLCDGCEAWAETLEVAQLAANALTKWIDRELIAAEARRNRCAAAHNVDGHLLQVGRIDALREVRALIESPR